MPPLHHSIHLAQRGSFFGLKVVEAPPQYAVADTPESLEDTCVVRVRAVGLNFRDVLNVLGEYPGDPGPPGADCAGDGVVAVVSGETTEPACAHGTRVFGVGNGSLSLYIEAPCLLPTALSAAVLSAQDLR